MISRKSAIVLGTFLVFVRATLATGTASAPQRYVFNRMDLATSSQPVSVVTGDFNGDGKPDIAVIHQNSTSLCVFLANPDSTFGPCVTTTITATATIGPSSLVAGDFNGDGKLDLAFVNGSSTVGVLLGNGDGTFAAEKDFAAPSGAVSLATGDLNGDGRLDLVVGAQGGLAAYLGNGDGTFSNSWTLNHTCQVPTVCVQVLLGDFNGDGKLDLAITFPNDVVVDVQLGNGDGTFQSFFVTTSLNHSASGMAIADLNGDGKLDLVTADLDGFVSVLIGQGDGSFSVTSYLVGGTCAPCGVPTSVVAADFNGDGKPDVAVTYSGVDPSGILVFLNSGGGALGTPVKYPAGLNSYALAFADFNQDGLADLVVANEGSSNISVLVGDSGGTFLSKTPFALPSQGTSIAVGDFDGDGLPDLAVTSTSLSAFLGAVDGSFHSSYNVSFGLSPTATVVGDFNNDSKLDVLLNFPPSLGFQGGAEVFLGNGNGTFSPLPADSRVGGSAALAVGDFNGDGKVDRAVVNTTANSVSIQLGNGDGTFQPPVSYSTGLGPASIVTGDFNNDGKLDLAVTNNVAGTVSILLGNGDGTFQAHQDYGPIGSAALTSSLAVADFNGDGNLDLAVATNTTNIAIFLGKGDGTFQTGQLYSVGTHIPSLVTSGDFNADGTIDLAVGFSSVDNFLLLPGNGDGTFQSSGLNFLGFSTQGAVALAAGKFGSAGGLGLAELFQPIGAPQLSNSVFVFLNKPVVSLFPASLVFQPQQIGVTSPPQIITVYNPSSAQLIISRIDKTGDFAETDTCTTAPILPGGNCIITGTFAPTASGLRTGTFILTTNAAAGQQVINLSSTQESTATTLTSSANPSLFGQSIMLTADVTSSAGDPVSGTVTFTDGGIVIGSGILSNGSTTFSAATLSIGSHSLQATYSPNGGFLGSSSAVQLQTVNAASTTINISCSSSGPGLHVLFIGQRILCGAVVTPVSPATGIPAGTATLYDGGTPIDTEPIGTTVRNGGVIFNFSAGFSTAGPHLLTAQYFGDSNFLGSTTSSTSTLQVSPLSTSLGVLASSTNPSAAGSSVTFTVPLSVQMAQTPSLMPQITGAVTVSDGSNVLGSVSVGPSTPIVSGVISISLTTSLASGIHIISASYSGDNNFTGSGPATLTQTVNKNTSSISLVANPNPSLTGRPVVFTSSVTGSAPAGVLAPTGSVTFLDGGTALGLPVTLTLTGGQLTASFPISTLSPGVHSITAQYSGDGNYNSSNSSPVIQTVNGFSTTTTISAPSVAYGTSASATISVSSSGGTVVGNVTLSVDGGAASTMPLSNGSASFNLTSLGAGSHSLSANFAAQGNFLASSAAGAIFVAQAPLTITANNVSRQYGQSNPSSFTVTYSGFVNGDTSTLLTGSLNCTTTAGPSSPTGAYPITCIGLSSPNYLIAFVPGTLTVTKAVLTVTAKNATKILNAPNPTFGWAASGFVNGENSSILTATPTCTSTATTTSPVGTYPITCSGANAANYTFSYVSGTLSITYQVAGICDGDLNHQILQPINADGTSVWKQGRTIPAKFRVCDANGVSVSAPGTVANFALVQIIAGTVTTVDETVTSTNSDTAFRWDPTGQQWIFNISTNNLSAGYTYVYAITLNDGSVIMFQYGLR